MPITKIAASGFSDAVNFRNLIINGDMSIAQRGTSTSSVTTTDGYYACDRWYSQTDTGTWTISQSTDVPTGQGFVNSFKMDCTSAGTSNADEVMIRSKHEGQNLQYLKYGTSSAESLTLSFWIKSNKTGTGNIQLKDKDNSNRQCTQSYTISSANTWEHKVCVFGADITGAFGDDNAKSLIINWWLGSGTDYSSGTANHGVWEAQDNTKVNSGGTLNINDNTANDWSITGIQLEVGEFTSSTLPPFQNESYGDNLYRCLRYYEARGQTVNSEIVTFGQTIANNKCICPLQFVTKRAVPSFSLGVSMGINQYNGVGWQW